MNRYLIISNHTPEDCRKAFKYFREHYPSFLTCFEWGCYDNDHHAYAILEAENHEIAKMAVPPLFRHKAQVIKLTKYDLNNTADPVHELINKDKLKESF
ncbi:MAG: hypothetical protein WD267_09470 [Balneolales bacterium]